MVRQVEFGVDDAVAAILSDQAMTVVGQYLNLAEPLTDDRRAWWVKRFRGVGFTFDGRLASPPPVPLVLYRGATDVGRFGLSWSLNLVVAEWFARVRGGEVWACVVPLERVLAWVDEGFGDQQVRGVEVVADVEGLALVRADDLRDRSLNTAGA